ncbi:MAG: hypothetical protein ACK5PP_03205, partial [Acidimicrobiales bacterium]
MVAPPQAGAVGDEAAISTAGRFLDPTRTIGTNLQCVRFGSDESGTSAYTPVIPATQDPTNGTSSVPGAGNQVFDNGILNEVRFGEIPQGIRTAAATQGTILPQCPDRFDSANYAGMSWGGSGFGYRGALATHTVGTYRSVGEFFHFNRAIEKGIQQVDLQIDYSLAVGADTVDYVADYLVTIEETQDAVDLPLTPVNEAAAHTCAYPDNPKNHDILGPGDVVIARQCADRVTVDWHPETGPTTVDVGEITLRLDVAGFAPVVDGVCDAADIVEGITVFTREQATNGYCLLARLVPAGITIDKTVNGADGTFPFTLTEYDQSPTLTESGRWYDLEVTTDQGTGTVTHDIEPGLYRLEEILAAGYVNETSCT